MVKLAVDENSVSALNRRTKSSTRVEFDASMILNMIEGRKELHTAQRGDRSVDRSNQNTFPVELRAGQLGLTIWSLKTNLLQRLCIKQNPANLDHLGRVLCDIDPVLIACGGHVNNHVTIHS